jgi:hypothetical protein
LPTKRTAANTISLTAFRLLRCQFGAIAGKMMNGRQLHPASARLVTREAWLCCHKSAIPAPATPKNQKQSE